MNDEMTARNEGSARSPWGATVLALVLLGVLAAPGATHITHSGAPLAGASNAILTARIADTKPAETGRASRRAAIETITASRDAADQILRAAALRAERFASRLEGAWREARRLALRDLGDIRVMLPARSTPRRVGPWFFAPAKTEPEPVPAPVLNRPKGRGLNQETIPAHSITALYFDFGSADIAPGAGAELLRDLREHTSLSDAEVIEVSGHTDAAGPTVVNLALSERRAEAARAYLEANLRVSVRYLVSAHGESALATPTADGVRERRNRRVEIVVR